LISVTMIMAQNV
jgi:hypothetical protein